jgi:CPA2 family monovalent cation:H+ antiporter-2
MQINTFGQFCLLMIVCSLGLEFSLDKIQAVWMISLLGTLLMGMASSLLSCIIGIYLFQVSFQQSLFVGLILSLSSTVVAVKCLQSSGDKGVIGTIVGKSVMGVLVAQDLLFCIALAILPVFASGHAGTWNFVKTVIIFVFKTTTFTISVMLVSRLIANIAPWAMFDHLRVIGFVALATITGHYFGVSVELGVFLAAMAVSTFTPADHPVYHALHETRDQRIVTLSEFASIFFFASIGLLLDMRFLWGELFLLVPFSLFIVIVKATATALIMKMLSLEWRHAITVGVDLAQVSELALLLGARGRRLGLITGESYYVLAGVTALGMILAPILWRFTNCIDTGMKRREMECI